MKDFELRLNKIENRDINIVPIMSIDGKSNLNEVEIPQTLPILTLRDAVLFPGTVLPITIGRDKSKKLVNALNKSTKIIGTVTQIDSEVEEPARKDLHDIGTSASILKLIEMPDGTITAILQGIKRFRLKEIISTEPYNIGTIETLNDILPDKNDKDVDAIAESIKDKALYILKLSPHLPQEAAFAIKNIEGLEFLTNFIASGLELEKPLEKMRLLNEGDLKARAFILLEMLNNQIELIKIKDDIQQKVKSEMDQQQREYYLNNQLKTIQEELGMDKNSEDIIDLRQKAEKKLWKAEIKAVFEKGLSKLEKTNPSSPEYNVQYNYLEFMVDLPWEEYSKDNMDLKNAQKVLDKDHFGLETVKERIIEHLALMKIAQNTKSPILCLYGPPGVGKTSLGKSIAKALGREYERISLGGLHDESEIRGHRRTYIGAMEGRILHAIKRAGKANPVIVLDEIDKVGADYKGDPASALLEVLDPEQNSTFHDNYLDEDFDLSKVLFIATANDTSSIHPALKDRMEMIQVSGYLPEEKYHIAKDHLIPEQIKESGLTPAQLNFSRPAINTIIDEYTRESGVRGLKKQIAKIARNRAKKLAFGEDIEKPIDNKEVKEILGLPTNFHDIQKGNEATGVVTGLAWTEMGGEILFVECSITENGKGVLTSTGNLGDVMKESITIAYQYIKAHSALLGLKPEDITNKDFHIHVPEGAIPKDGPSAGITMVSAIASALLNKKVRSSIAMTGEMTLRGKVLPVGGIKEKILAAKRAGVSTIILSADNERDIKEIKDIYTKGLTFKYVKTADQVISYIFK